MRIRSMDVSGFGIFDGKRFELSKPFVLFYGENEAGKSTLLQFVRSMLFGFPTRAQPEIRYEPIRGGRYGGSLMLEFDDGSSFRLERYADQGRAAKLIYPDGTIADEQVLQDRLGGMTSQMYRHLFAFGLTELQQLQTLQTEEAGQFLFSTGFGADTSRLLKTEKKLEQEKDHLFRPKGTSQPMYQHMLQLERARQELSVSFSLQDEYNELTNQIDANDTEVSRLESELSLHLKRADQLQAAISLRERWHRSKEIEKELAALPDLSNFSLDLIEKWDKLTDRIIQKEEERASARWKLKQHAEKEAALIVDDQLLHVRDELETLWAGLGVYRENKERLRAARAQAAFEQKALTKHLAELDESWTIEDLEAFPISMADRKQVIDFRDQKSLAEREMIRLNDAVARLSERENIEKAERDTLRQACEKSEQLLAERLARITPLSYPSFQTKAEQYFEQMYLYREQKRQLELETKRFEDTKETLNWLGESEQRTPRRRSERKKRSQRLLLTVTLFLQIALPAASWWFEQQTAAWIIFALLAGYHISLFSRMKSSSGFEEQSNDRPESDKRSVIAEKLSALEKEIENRNKQFAETCHKLERLLKDILHPEHEAAAGLDRLAGISKRRAQFSDEAEDVFEKWQIHLEKELNILLQMVENVDETVNQAELQEERYEEVRSELERQQKIAAEARLALDQIEAEWEQWIEARRLSNRIVPETLLEMFRMIEQAKSMLAEMEQRNDECKQLEQEIARYEAHAAKFIPFDRSDELPALLKQRKDELALQTERKLERKAWERRMIELQEELAQVEIELKSLIDQQQLVLQTAGVSSENELRLKQQAYDRKQRWTEELAQLDRVLESWEHYGTKEELEQLLQLHGPEQLEYELEHARSAADTLKHRLNELKKQLGALTLKKEQLLGSRGHADRLQSYEDAREQLVQTAEKWAVRALSYALIQKTKALVEAQRQPRVLQKASAYFAKMTNGSFTRITVPAFEKKIIAVREDGEQLETSLLSRGTAEQLYLSMRFALVEEYSRHTRLPIVLDDIFVNFDDERMQRTLSILRDISRNNQVLMFTCHRHVREAVQKLIPQRHEIVLRRRHS